MPSSKVWLLVVISPCAPPPISPPVGLLDFVSVELVAFKVCDEIDAVIKLDEVEGVGPTFTSLADRRLVDRPSLEANDMDKGDACSAELTISGEGKWKNV